jgi:hypothetical protein
LKDLHLQDPEEILSIFQELWDNITLRNFKWHLNHGAIGCARSLNMTESTFINGIFTNRLFHGQVKIGHILITFRSTCIIERAIKKDQSRARINSNHRNDRFEFPKLLLNIIDQQISRSADQKIKRSKDQNIEK